MILTQSTVTFLISTISLILAYFVAVTGANYFKAWFAHKVGDDTPSYLGFLTLNPLAHIDPIGLALIAILQFGWGRHIPINPLNIQGKWRKTKISMAFLADSFAYIIIAICALVLLLFLFDGRVISISHYMILYRSLSHLTLAAAYTTHASFTVTIGFILISIMYLSVLLSVLQGVINGVYLGAVLMVNKSPQIIIDRNTVMIVLILLFIVLPLLGIVDIVNILRTFVVNVISYGGYYIARILGRI